MFRRLKLARARRKFRRAMRNIGKGKIPIKSLLPRHAGSIYGGSNG